MTKKGPFFVTLFCFNFHRLEALEVCLEACLEACPEVFCANFHGLATLEFETETNPKLAPCTCLSWSWQSFPFCSVDERGPVFPKPAIEALRGSARLSINLKPRSFVPLRRLRPKILARTANYFKFNLAGTSTIVLNSFESP